MVDDTTFLAAGVSVIARGFVDGLGRPIQTAVKDGTASHITATQYDLNGRVWRVWKPYPGTWPTYATGFASAATAHYNTYLGQTQAKPYVETQYTTDRLSRPVKVIPEYVSTSTTVFTQTFYGTDATAKQQFTEVTDELSKKTRTYNNVFGSGVKTILGYGAAEASTTNLTADILNRRTQASDPRSLNTTFSWNTRGLLTSKTSPDAGTVQQKYETLLAPVPHRQVVLTIPQRRRASCLFRRGLVGDLARVAARTVTAAVRATTGEADLAVGIIACLQTHGSLANWHPHLHLVVTDGGFRPDGTFVRWPGWPGHDTARLTEAFRRAVLRLFVRRGLFEEDQAAGMLRWPHSGFQVHAGVGVPEADRAFALRLARYCARNPVVLERLT